MPPLEVTVLAIGDIIGRPGRDAVARVLPGLRRDQGIDLVVANGENAAGGFGLTPKIADDLFALGIDVLTSGNHIWDQREMLTGFDSRPILRPHNYSTAAPGRGWYCHDLGEKGRVLVGNVQGQLFMPPMDSPFRAADEVLRQAGGTPVRLFDMHAEATSEKMALGWYLDGRASFVFGTHTHVPTADARILPNGTAFVSDLGMVGPRDSVIGMDREISLQRFLTGLPHRFKVAEGVVSFNSVLVRIDGHSGNATFIERIDRSVSLE
ncbi:MAG TPA: TIGR00282 family metallophosphoesterase [Candidatus Limnocylindrales bacterium]|nr:TIGR00282 family metallophosphoesterase [Candidatus Limnocylindrales bacterium]